MALDPKVKQLLNDFSKSQPALNLEGKPAAESGIPLGDLIDAGGTDNAALAQEISDRQSGDSALDTRLTALESFKDSQVLFVSKSGSDVSGTGGQHKPFASIGVALAAITDASPTKRYLIKVLAGAYTEGALALKANVFICGDQKEAVRITASSFALASDFSGSADNRSGMSKVIIASGNASFDWAAVTSAAGKLYFSEVSFGGTVSLNGHNNAIAQAQFDSCIFFAALTISGINVEVFNNNTCYGNINLDQHPNGGMATILNAAGGQVFGNVTLTTTVIDFNRRCSLFARNLYMEYVTVNGASSYADMNEGSLPRSHDRIVSQNGGNIVYITSNAPHAANVRNLGEAGKQYAYVFGWVHASSDTDLYLISMGADYNPANTGRSIFLQADSWGLQDDVNGGDINLITATTSGSGVRGKVKLNGLVVDVSASKIVDLAAGVDATDAVNKGQLDAVSSAVSGRLDVLESRAFKKEVFTLTATDISNGYVDLGFEARPNSVVAFFGRLAMHEGVSADYTVSVVGGVSRITFLNNMVLPSEEALSSGDILNFTYEAK